MSGEGVSSAEAADLESAAALTHTLTGAASAALSQRVDLTEVRRKLAAFLDQLVEMHGRLEVTRAKLHALQVRAMVREMS